MKTFAFALGLACMLCGYMPPSVSTFNIGEPVPNISLPAPDQTVVDCWP